MRSLILIHGYDKNEKRLSDVAAPFISPLLSGWEITISLPIVQLCTVPNI
jgi:hypothetical protein